jgi:hypothetical protein
VNPACAGPTVIIGMHNNTDPNTSLTIRSVRGSSPIVFWKTNIEAKIAAAIAGKLNTPNNMFTLTKFQNFRDNI